MIAFILASMILGIFFMAIRHDNYLELRVKRGIPYCTRHGESCLKGCMLKLKQEILSICQARHFERERLRA